MQITIKPAKEKKNGTAEIVVTQKGNSTAIRKVPFASSDLRDEALAALLDRVEALVKETAG